MATFSYSRDRKTLVIKPLAQHGAEMPLSFCAAGFIIFGLATAALGQNLVGAMTVVLGCACLGILFVETRIQIRRSGDLRVRHTLFGTFSLFGRSFGAGTWQLKIVPGPDWAEGIRPWHFVIKDQSGRSAVPYAFPRKQGAVRLRQRILAFLDDSPF